MGDISIIIPIYNVERYLEQCLESVKKLTEYLQVEVIMIDDGSTDESGTIAKRYSDVNKEFYYYRQENHGLGNARNRGASLAKGKYLMFIDSDDVIDANVWLHMFRMAEKNQTELTICDAARIKGESVSGTPTFLYSFQNLQDTVTHITKHPALIYDTTAWNKLILRSFYCLHKFSFQENVLYEDIPVTVPLHYFANEVSVVCEVGYYWRIRTGKDLSITQQKMDKKNLADKIAMFQKAFEFLDSVEESQIRTMLEVRQWGYDYVGYLNLLNEMSQQDALEYVELFANFVEKNMSQAGYDSLSLNHQQIIHDVLKRDVKHLIKVMNYNRTNYENAPVIEWNKEKVLLLSNEIFTISNRSVKNEFRWKAERCSIDDVKIVDKKTWLIGHIYHRKINIPEGSQKVRAYLWNLFDGEKIELPTNTCKTSWLTEEIGNVINYDDYENYYYNYDGTGFEVELDFKQLEKFISDNAMYKILVEYENELSSGVRILRGIKKEKQKSVARIVYCGDTLDLQVSLDSRDTIQINTFKKGYIKKKNRTKRVKRLLRKIIDLCKK